MYLTQQCWFTFNFHKINKQKHNRWVTWNKLNAKSVVLLHEYMHGDVYDTHQLRVIDDAQLMTESVINDALLQAMPHIKHRACHADSVLWWYDILSDILATTFLIKYCSLLGSD